MSRLEDARREAEARLQVNRLPGAQRVARRQFRVAEGRHPGYQRGEQERPGRKNARGRDNLADQHVNAGAENVAEPVKCQQRQRQRAPERGAADSTIDVGFGHEIVS